MRIRNAFLGGLFGLLAVGCAGNGGDGATPTNSVLRVVHAISDAPAVSATVDGVAVVTGLGYKSVSSFINIAKGDRLIRAVRDDTSAEIVNKSFDVPGNYSYTLAAIGTLADTDLILLQNPILATSANGWVRIINGARTAGTVDLHITPGTGTPSYTVANRVADNLPFRSFTAHLNLAPGTYTLSVRAADSSSTFATFPFTVAADGRISLLVIDADGGGTPYQALTLNDERVAP